MLFLVTLTFVFAAQIFDAAAADSSSGQRVAGDRGRAAASRQCLLRLERLPQGARPLYAHVAVRYRHRPRHRRRDGRDVGLGGPAAAAAAVLTSAAHRRGSAAAAYRGTRQLGRVPLPAARVARGGRGGF